MNRSSVIVFQIDVDGIDFDPASESNAARVKAGRGLVMPAAPQVFAAACGASVALFWPLRNTG